jgi:predicted kinase
VVLVGATAAGKSHWAREWFHPDQVVSSDRLRAMVGTGERDQRASRDAFELLDLIVERRLRRRLVTVIDTTGLEAGRREAWRGLAARHGVPAYAVPSTRPPRRSVSATAPAAAPCPARS